MTLSLSEQTRAGGLGESVVLTAVGQLDVHTAPGLRERFIHLLNDGQRRLVLDLEGVEFLDATGLGVLAGAMERARQAGGSLRLVCTQQPVLDVLRITGLDRVFPIDPSVEKAVADVR